MIVALRFIERNGKKILQSADEDDCHVENGEIVYVWNDVPLEEKS